MLDKMKEIRDERSIWELKKGMNHSKKFYQERIDKCNSEIMNLMWKDSLKETYKRTRK